MDFAHTNGIRLTTFTTSEAGTGAGHFVRRATTPPVPQFDMIFRVVRLNADGTLDFSQVRESACMTVTVK